MLQLFRRLRFKIILTGNNLKYLKYAFGEILLVVIGILIALQVNNWNEERKNRILGQILLAKLKKEYNENLEEINSKILIRKRMMSSIEYLLTYPSILVHVRRTTVRPTMDPVEGVTSVILNSGQLSLIKNEKLALFLSNWTGLRNKVIEEEQDMVLYTTQNYYTYRIHNYNLFYLQSASENDLAELYSINQKIQAGGTPEHFETSLVSSAEECKRYLTDKVVRNYLLRLYKSCNTTNNQSLGLKSEIENALIIIDQEME